MIIDFSCCSWQAVRGVRQNKITREINPSFHCSFCCCKHHLHSSYRCSHLLSLSTSLSLSTLTSHGQSHFKIGFRQLRRYCFVTKPIYHEQHNRFVAETGLNRSKWQMFFSNFWKIEDSLSFRDDPNFWKPRERETVENLSLGCARWDCSEQWAGEGSSSCYRQGETQPLAPTIQSSLFLRINCLRKDWKTVVAGIIRQGDRGGTPLIQGSLFLVIKKETSLEKLGPFYNRGKYNAPEIHIWILGLFPKIVFEYVVFWKNPHLHT